MDSSFITSRQGQTEQASVPHMKFEIFLEKILENVERGTMGNLTLDAMFMGIL